MRCAADDTLCVDPHWVRRPSGRLPKKTRREAATILRHQFSDRPVKYSLITGTVLFAVTAPAAAQWPPPPLYDTAEPARTCESLTTVDLADTTVDSAALETAGPGGPPYCRVTAIATHPPANDRVTIWVALPTETWNGRFLGTGGGGFSGGSPRSLPAAVREGFAAAATDTGHEQNSGSFALGPDGALEWMLIRDNAYLGIHAMTRVGKELTAAFYGRQPKYSYFRGCSTGGRQGLMEVQRYPDDYDGVLSGAPAINWDRLHLAQMWGQLVMLEAGHFVRPCAFRLAQARAVEACDMQDGLADDVIPEPRQCPFDPAELLGAEVESCGPITEADIAVLRKILEGPRRRDGSFLWYGLTPGTDFLALNGTTRDPLGGAPMRITLDWFRYFLARDPDLDWTGLTHASYEHYWDQSVEEFGRVFGTDRTDLSGFRDRGGKAIVWHGWSDPLIYAQGTVDWFEGVEDRMGDTGDFLRLFMVPGARHCRDIPGITPENPFAAVVRWVEEGVPPDTLDAVRRDGDGEVLESRPICRYPKAAIYSGSGDPNDAASFECRELR